MDPSEEIYTTIQKFILYEQDWGKIVVLSRLYVLVLNKSVSHEGLNVEFQNPFTYP